MRISNWESAKKQAITKLPAFTITAAVIFFIATFLAFWNGRIDYQEQIKQLEWATTTATVNYVDEYWDAFFSQNGGATVYDIYYEYEVDDQLYTGSIEEEITPQNVGDVFQIKYNPKAPEEHTRTLEPSKSYLVSGSVFAALGLAMAIITVVLIRKGRTLVQS